MNGKAMIISSIVIYVVAYLMDKFSIFVTFLPPLRLLFRLGVPILKLVGAILFISGLYTAYKNNSKFTNINDKENQNN